MTWEDIEPYVKHELEERQEEEEARRREEEAEKYVKVCLAHPHPQNVAGPGEARKGIRKWKSRWRGGSWNLF